MLFCSASVIENPTDYGHSSRISNITVLGLDSWCGSICKGLHTPKWFVSAIVDVCLGVDMCVVGFSVVHLETYGMFELCPHLFLYILM